MLKNFENWLLENNYSASTSADYMGRIERLCRKEEFIRTKKTGGISPFLSVHQGHTADSRISNCLLSPC